MTESKSDYTCPKCGGKLMEVQEEEPETPGTIMEIGICSNPKCAIFVERESMPVAWKPWRETPACNFDWPELE